MLVMDSAWQIARSATFFLVCMENLQDQIDCIGRLYRAMAIGLILYCFSNSLDRFSNSLCFLDNSLCFLDNTICFFSNSLCFLDKGVAMK